MNLDSCPNVRLIEAALGNESCWRAMKKGDGRNAGDGYLDGDGDIPTVKIDDLNLESCDLIWLDIQGHETEAIEGGWKTIEQFHPVIVLEEDGLPYTKKWGFDHISLSKKLLDFGYTKTISKNHDFVYQWI